MIELFSLFYPLENEVKIDGEVYQLNLYFDTVLKIIDLLKNKRVSEVTKLNLCLKMLFGRDSNLVTLPIEQQNMIFNEVFDTFITKKEEKVVQYDLQGNELPEYEEDSKRNYSLKHDAEYIYASFLQAYGMDLIEQQGKLDWRKFQALLSGLPDDTKFKQVLHVRTWKKPSKSDTEAKQMNKLKEIYKLPDED